MEKRSKELLQVGFFLSKFGNRVPNSKYPSPPLKLGVEKWNDAYQMFYDKLGGGRSILSFERTLKNTRDEYDSHFPGSGRIGWRVDNRKPRPLSSDASLVFEQSQGLTEDQIWQIIQPFADTNIKERRYIIEDLIAIQESEKDENISITEGQRKVITLRTYERSISARIKAIDIHGLTCKVCGFNFYETYGDWGKGFIEVHHLQALSESVNDGTQTNPSTDLTVLCSNCHRMIHRKRGVTLSIEELKRKLSKQP